MDGKERQNKDTRNTLNPSKNKALHHKASATHTPHHKSDADSLATTRVSKSSPKQPPVSCTPSLPERAIPSLIDNGTYMALGKDTSAIPTDRGEKVIPQA
ncbi:hypothetical protein E4U21_002895 [Claviceps maximensis]|nr:hypothetical protein E4U21_002895 [Claviceps maximensis]